jgi:catechol 2,3-dioxygenase-like lactoylglutathione lyase family enzyme
VDFRGGGATLTSMADKARLVGINHVVLEVDDLEEGLDFYGRLFEFELRGRSGQMAFLDMGDQFLVLAEGRSQPPDGSRHFGLVVDDKERVRRLAEQAGAEMLGGRGLDFLDPWGNHVQVVQYSDVQFTKAPSVVAGMGIDDLEKTPAALEELRQKGLL